MPGASVRDELVCSGEAIQEAAAGSLYVEGSTLCTQGMLYQIGSRRKWVIGADSSDYDESEILTFDSSPLQGLASRRDGEGGGSFSRHGDMALLDTTTRCDPLISGINHTLHVGVGEDSLGNTHSPAS